MRLCHSWLYSSARNVLEASSTIAMIPFRGVEAGFVNMALLHSASSVVSRHAAAGQRTLWSMEAQALTGSLRFTQILGRWRI